MDIVQFISQFFYRIRYWLLWGSLIVTALVIYFTQFLPFKYTVNSSIYAGVTNSINIDGSKLVNINSTFDNLINIAKSKSTLEKVSVRLLATSFVYGEEWKDNMYIQAKHYRQLTQITPKEVLALVDRSSLDKTIQNFTEYRKEHSNNFIYAMYSRPRAFYSYEALNTIIVKRLGVSDIIELSYTSSDPGITQNTLKILEDELIKAYEILRFSATNNVIAYFEEQVRLAKQKLTEEENDLMHYNVEKQVINYDEQTKALATTKYEVDDREEAAKRTYESALALRQMLEDKMDIRAKIIRTNTNLLKELEKVSSLNQSIMEQEIFTTEKSQNNSGQLSKEKQALKNAEDKISSLSDDLNEYGFSKEGVGIQNMVDEWLLACINEAKAKAELKVLDNRKGDIISQYQTFSPVGTQVKRKERAIGIAEDTYREQLRGLSEARLRLQNIKMSPANFQIGGIQHILIRFQLPFQFNLALCLIQLVLSQLRAFFRSLRHVLNNLFRLLFEIHFRFLPYRFLNESISMNSAMPPNIQYAAISVVSTIAELNGLIRKPMPARIESKPPRIAIPEPATWK